jgi:predicted RNA binding protein YcfA (HicA-like mRNA interferase family)
MPRWPSTQARRVLKALHAIGWIVKRQSGGSHRILDETAPGRSMVFETRGACDAGPAGGIAGSGTARLGDGPT